MLSGERCLSMVVTQGPISASVSTVLAESQRYANMNLNFLAYTRWPMKTHFMDGKESKILIWVKAQAENRGSRLQEKNGERALLRVKMS